MLKSIKTVIFVLPILILSACGQLSVDGEAQATVTLSTIDASPTTETNPVDSQATDLAPDPEFYNNDFCQEEQSADSPEEFACQLIEHLTKQQIDSLANLMADPFTLMSSEQGGGGGREDPPSQAVSVLFESFLPPKQDAMYFSINPDQDLTLPGPPGTTGKAILIILSEGWGQEGLRSANLFITQNESGEYSWYGVHINKLE